MLDQSWRVGITADPAAANPGFDDSSWAIRQGRGSFADVADDTVQDDDRGPGRSRERPYAWFRIHIKLAPNHGPLALLIELPVSHNTSMDLGTGQTGPDVDVFANGRLIRPDGPHGDEAAHYQSISRLYNLNLPEDETSLTLVIRTMHIPFGLSAYTHFFATRTLRLGHPEDLARILELWTIHTLFEHLPRLINSLLLFILSLFLFALYFTQKGTLSISGWRFTSYCRRRSASSTWREARPTLTSSGIAALILQLVLISAYLYFEFLYAFLALRRRWYIQPAALHRSDNGRSGSGAADGGTQQLHRIAARRVSRWAA